MTKDLQKYLEAKQEAMRFVNRVNELLERHETDQEMRLYLSCGVGYKETASVKRASLDLTRCLAKMRKP